MRRFSIVGTIVVTLTLLVGLSWLGLRLIGRSFVTAGEQSGEVEALSAEATITRDQYGVPYINAANEADAMAALGYAHAQDRLWQMDVMRRAGEGRLAEIFGRGVVQYDALLRTVGFRRIAAEIVKKMPAKTRASVNAYCRGVNAFIESHQGRYPMEFDALGYVPEPWTPEHSVLISRLLAWELNTSYWTDIVFGDIQRRVDSVRFSQILPYYPSDGATIIPGGQHPEPLLEQLNAPPPPPVDTTKRDSTLLNDTTARPSAYTPRSYKGAQAPDLAGVILMEREMRRFLGIDGSHIGSNAWAIAANRTAGGKAMLANDPHLPHTAPSRWYQTVINYEGHRLGGVTLPGMPFIVVGRNNDVSWGLTSLMADETDFYVERLDSAKRTTMLVDGEWEKLTIIRDTIQVKDSASVPFVIRIGKHGPFISDLHPFAPKTSGKPDTSWLLAASPVAMRWRGNDVSGEMMALQGINNARNLQEFTAAVRLGGVPSLCFVYADREGNIASIPVARIPVREGTLMNLPNPGWESRYDWKGSIPPEKLPMLVNPESGFVASANNKVANNLPFAISDLWEDPSRAMRIEELLKEGNNYGVTDFVQMQGDLVSPHMRYMTEFLLRAFPDSVKQGSAVRAALAKLRSWNGGMIADGPEAAITAQWLQSVLEMTYRDEMGPDLYRNYAHFALLPTRAIRHHVMIDSRWFDDVTTKTRIETRDDILRKALGRALDSLHARFDSWDIGTWRFGAMHILTFPHLFEKNEKLRGIVNIGPFETGGAGTTINNGEWDLNQPFKVRVGPSMRQIIDFADTSAFLRSVITTGASGQPLNQYYKNQTVLWMSNGYLSLAPAPPTGADVTSVTRLAPRGRDEG
jgi:penicillin G amidase